MNKLNDTQLISVTNTITDLLNSIPIDETSIETINLAADVLLLISERNTTTENLEVVQSFMNTVNTILYQPIDHLSQSQNVFNSSNKFDYNKVKYLIFFLNIFLILI